MPWAKLWQDIRRRIDARREQALTLTVDEIPLLTGTDQSIDKPWWWDMMTGHPEVGAVPLADYGIQCQTQVLDNRVYAVTFTRDNRG